MSVAEYGIFTDAGTLPYIGMALKAEKQEMARRRAMLTDTERELLESDEKTDRYYQAVSRVRRKINEELSTDIEILEENHPELLEELKEVVCEEE